MQAGGKNGRRMHLAALRDISNTKGLQESMQAGPQTRKRTAAIALSQKNQPPEKKQALSKGAADASKGDAENRPAENKAEAAPDRAEVNREAAGTTVEDDSARAAEPAKADPARGSAEEVRSRLYSYLHADDQEEEEGPPTGSADRTAEEEELATERTCSTPIKGTEEFDTLVRSLLPFSHEGGRRSAEEDTLVYHKTYIHCDPGGQRVSRRQQLVNWMLHLQLRLNLLTETLHTAVVFADCFLACEGQMDKFLMHQPAPPVIPPEQQSECDEVQDCILFDVKLEPPTRLRRLGATCLFIAAKMIEIVCPSAFQFATATNVPGFLRKNIVMAEKVLLATLDYQLCLSASTSYAFANAYCEVFPAHHHQSTKIKLLVAYLIDLALLVHHGLEYPPSLIAAAALSVAEERFAGPDIRAREELRENLERITGYTDEDLHGACTLLDQLVEDAPAYDHLAANVKHQAIIKTLDGVY